MASNPNFRVLVMELIPGIRANKWVTKYDGYHEADATVHALELSRVEAEEKLG